VADLTIKEEEGWIEITDLIEEILPHQVSEEMWTFLAEGDQDGATALLTAEIGQEIEGRTGIIREVRMAELPGEPMRIWVRS
jgi:hypothetical protein